MLARKEDAYLYDIPVPAEAAPAVQAEVPREPLLRHQLNTNLRNCLRAVFFLVACGAMAVTLLGGIGASITTTAVLMALVVASLWIGDHPSMLRRNRHQVVMVDRAISDETALTDHLSRLLNARIHSIEVQRLDLVNDTTLVDVRYQLHRPCPQAETSAPAPAAPESLASPVATLPPALSPAEVWNPVVPEAPSYRPQREPRNTTAVHAVVR